MVHFPFCVSSNFKICCRLIQGLVVKAWKRYHIRRARILVPKIKKDVEVPQSAKHI